VRIAAKVGVEAEWNEVPVDVIGLNLSPGEPAGSIAGAGASGSSQGAAIGGGENEDGLVLSCRALAGLGYAGQPVDLSPGTLTGLWLDEGMEVLELRLGLWAGIQAAC